MNKLLIANWKMNGAPALAREMAALGLRGDVVICPPAVYLHEIAGILSGSGLALGAQDCHAEPEGAFTGDISARMAKEAGCEYVIVGHSERRQFHHETDDVVAAKAGQALANGLKPVICIGESEAQRVAGQAEDVVARQVRASSPGGSGLIFAYEPVWAIGSGKTPTLADIEAMHRAILAVAGAGARVLYGGSVKAANARDILAAPGVSGVLVGGASLKPEEFRGIAEAI